MAKKFSGTEVKVNEKSRKVISNSGAVLSLHNVKSFDSRVNDFIALNADEGFVILNNNNVFAHVINFDEADGTGRVR